MYAQGNRASKTDRTKERKDEPTVMVGDSDIDVSVIDRTSKRKFIKEGEDLNNIINQFDLIFTEW